MADVRLQVNLPHTPPPIWVSTLLAEPPLPIPSVRTLWMILLLAHLAHSFQSFEDYEKNFQLVFYLRVFTIICHRRIKVSSQ